MTKIRIQSIVIFISFLIICFIGFPKQYSYAEDASTSATPTPDNTHDKLNDLQKQINDLQKKVDNLKSQEKSLGTEISVIDNQIKLTQLRMNATKQEIAALTSDINIAAAKVKTLEKSVNDITKVLINRIVATYQTGSVQPLAVLLSSSDITDFLSRASYLRIVQAHDKMLIYDTQQARNDYENQKGIFEAKKQKVVALKAQLESYSQEIDQQKKDKQALLTVTKNNEAVYQQQLEAAQAEQAAISKIEAGGGNAVAVGSINEGDIVGHMIVGRSACSSGTHLHFEVHKDGNLQNPSNFLQNKSVTFDNSPDAPFSFTGSWRFPLDDPIRIEQGYGMTYWAQHNWYGGGPHTGIDMYSDSSLAVYAVKSGQLYRGGIACGSGTLLFARVDQNDGSQTFYLHILQ